MCCSRAISHLLTARGFLDREEPDIDEKELDLRLQKERKTWAPANRTNYWGSYAEGAPLNESRTMSPDFRDHLRDHTLHYGVARTWQEQDAKVKIAVELGCGNSSITAYLLNNGWTVYSVDSSQRALKALQGRINNAVADPDDRARLNIVCQDMESYQFPLDIDLVVAKDSLFYCDPYKIKIVWQRAHAALKRGGKLIGNFHPHPFFSFAEEAAKKFQGSWYTEKAVVRALLNLSKYRIDVCETPVAPWEELFMKPREIIFVGTKV